MLSDGVVHPGLFGSKRGVRLASERPIQARCSALIPESQSTPSKSPSRRSAYFVIASIHCRSGMRITGWSPRSDLPSAISSNRTALSKQCKLRVRVFCDGPHPRPQRHSHYRVVASAPDSRLQCEASDVLVCNSQQVVAVHALLAASCSLMTCSLLASTVTSVSHQSTGTSAFGFIMPFRSRLST